MKKTFKIEIDCANCAQKVEDAVNKIDGVSSCTVSFIAEKMTIEADDDKFDAIMKKVVKTSKKIEPDCEIYQ